MRVFYQYFGIYDKKYENGRPRDNVERTVLDKVGGPIQRTLDEHVEPHSLNVHPQELSRLKRFLPDPKRKLQIWGLVEKKNRNKIRDAHVDDYFLYLAKDRDSIEIKFVGTILAASPIPVSPILSRALWNQDKYTLILFLNCYLPSVRVWDDVLKQYPKFGLKEEHIFKGQFTSQLTYEANLPNGFIEWLLGTKGLNQEVQPILTQVAERSEAAAAIPGQLMSDSVPLEVEKDIRVVLSVPDIVPLLIEGATKQIYVDTHERDPGIVRIAKALGDGKCEVCGLSFGESYGDIGDGFIEAHHTVPLADGHRAMEMTDDSIRTYIRLLCSNCHRMIHRGANTLTVEELKSYWDKQHPDSTD